MLQEGVIGCPAFVYLVSATYGAYQNGRQSTQVLLVARYLIRDVESAVKSRKSIRSHYYSVQQLR